MSPQIQPRGREKPDETCICKDLKNPFKSVIDHGSTGDPGRSVWELRKTVEVEVTAWQGAA